MSGSFYTPYSFGGSSPGSAFRSGFVGAQEIERNAQQLEEADQMMKLRQLQNERNAAAEARAAQLFPLQYSASELALKRGAQMNPLEIEKMQLDLRRLRTELGNVEALRTGTADFLRGLNVPVTAPASAPVAPTQPGTASPGMYVRPPPGGGGQASLDAAPNQYYAANDPFITGGRSYRPRGAAGIQLASGGFNDFTGLPSGMPEPDFTVYPDTGYAATEGTGPSPTAPNALPAALLPPDQRYGVAPPPVVPAVPPAPAYMTDPYAGIPVGTVPRPEPRPVSESPALIRAFLERSQMIREAEAQANAAAAAPQQPGQLPQSRLDFTPSGGQFPDLTPGEVPATPTTRQAGVTPQGEQTTAQLTSSLLDRITSLSTTQRPPMSILSEAQIGRESEALDAAAAGLEQRRRAIVLLSRSNPTLALQEGIKLQSEIEALRLNRSNLNGRIALSEFEAGQPERLAADINRASGGVLRLERLENGKYNIWGREGEGRPRKENVTAEELLHEGRMLYDNNYKTQMEAIRTQNIERNNQVFKAFTDGLSETLKQQANMTAQTAIKFAEERAKAQYRAPTYDVKVDSTNASVIITNTQTGQQQTLRQVPAKDRNGRPIQGQWEFVPVESRATTTQ